MKPKERHREIRRFRGQSAQIALNGEATAECAIMDISKRGARIVPDGTGMIPAQFELAFAHGERKPCEVIWRRGRMLGVKFIR